MLVHHRNQIRLPKLNDFPIARIRHILSSDEYFRFALTRHPIDRFFSAWKDKIFLLKPGFEYYGFLRNEGEKFVAFEQFAEHVLNEERPEASDPHWADQTTLLGLGAFPYDRLYDVRSIHQLEEDFAAHLETIGHPEPVNFPQINESPPLPKETLISQAVADRLAQFYSRDFRFLGYNPGQFQETAIATQHYTGPWTDTCFDQNRMLSYHLAFARERFSSQD